MAIRHYVLLATDGFTQLPLAPDVCTTPHRSLYVFGFVGGLFQVDGAVIDPTLDYTNPANWPGLMARKGTATLPSPLIWGEVGDHLYVTLINLGFLQRPDVLDFHTVHGHGIHAATQTDGFPELSFGVPVWLAGAPPNATYFFALPEPGTYMYHCHVEASEHVQMGMYGALAVYPSTASLATAGITQGAGGKWSLNGVVQSQIPTNATNRNFAYNDIQTFFNKEYVLLLTDVDSTWHDSVLNNIPFNPVNFKPDWWLVNGRAFPDTLLPHPLTPPPGSNPNLTQITYESYPHVSTGDRFLLRTINLGYQTVPWHTHGYHASIIGRDARPSPFLLIGAKLGLPGPFTQEVFTATIGSGETFDLLFFADDKRKPYRNYIVNGQDGLPSLCSQLLALSAVDPASIFDIPTQPVACPTPTTTNYLEICAAPCNVNDEFYPQFYAAHNHDDYKVTNNGVYPGSQLIYIQQDPPLKWPQNIPFCAFPRDPG